MAFTESTITHVFPPQYQGRQVYLSWLSSAPAGTWFQIYINEALTWYGQRRATWVPIPTGPVRIDIGSVGPGEQRTDFSADLPSAPHRRVKLNWQSGYFQAADLAGFRIYSSTVAGGAINYTEPVAVVAAYPGGIDTSGYGLGGFGGGGFGSVASNYSWTGGPYRAGYWSFAVVPFDAAGNAGAGQTVTELVQAPPTEPPPFSDGSRLHYTFTPSMTTLMWNASSE